MYCTCLAHRWSILLIIIISAASLGMALASLIEAKGADLEGSKILMFSYGSGLAAGMFVLKGRAVPGAFALHDLQSKVRLSNCSAQALPLQCVLVAHDVALHGFICRFVRVDLSRLWQIGFNS